MPGFVLRSGFFMALFHLLVVHTFGLLSSKASLGVITTLLTAHNTVMVLLGWTWDFTALPAKLLHTVRLAGCLRGQHGRGAASPAAGLSRAQAEEGTGCFQARPWVKGGDHRRDAPPHSPSWPASHGLRQRSSPARHRMNRFLPPIPPLVAGDNDPGAQAPHAQAHGLSAGHTQHRRSRRRLGPRGCGALDARVQCQAPPTQVGGEWQARLTANRSTESVAMRSENASIVVPTLPPAHATSQARFCSLQCGLTFCAALLSAHQTSRL